MLELHMCISEILGIFFFFGLNEEITTLIYVLLHGNASIAHDLLKTGALLRTMFEIDSKIWFEREIYKVINLNI